MEKQYQNSWDFLNDVIDNKPDGCAHSIQEDYEADCPNDVMMTSL